MKNVLLAILISSCLLGECVSTGPPATPSAPPIATTRSSSRSPQLSQSPRADEQTAQTNFGAEEKMRYPVNVPEDILRLLRYDKRIQTRLGKGQSAEGMSASWFTASKIDLSDEGHSDLVVQAIDPRLFGANLVPFWVFRRILKGNKLLLSVDALGLEVLKTKTNNYKNIRTTKATAKEILIAYYEFDGDKYEERRSSREPIKH